MVMRNLGIIDEWIWATSIWDGPISGIAIVQNKKYFLILLDEDRVRNRVFKVFNLPSWFWKILEVDKKLFEKYVGVHTSFVDGIRCNSHAKSKDSINYYFNCLKTFSEDKIKKEWQIGTCFDFV